LPCCSRLLAFQKWCVSPKCLRVLAMGLPLIQASVCCAQQPGTARQSTPSQPHYGHRRVNLEERVNFFARNLNLDQAQQDAVLKILQARQEEELRIRRSNSASGGARIEQFRVLQDKTVLLIRAVLNEEQKKKYDPLAVRKLEPSTNQKTVEDWLELTAPKQEI
jgi:hypothetical protein